MITAIDTSVLLDVFGADVTFGPPSRDAVERCIAEGSIIACGVVWAEVSASFPSPEEAAAALDRLGVHFSSLERSAALSVGIAWRAYRSRGGPRTRVVPDFIIGAHALTQADRLLTRDSRFHRSYYSTLQVLDPSE